MWEYSAENLIEVVAQPFNPQVTRKWGSWEWTQRRWLRTSGTESVLKEHIGHILEATEASIRIPNLCACAFYAHLIRALQLLYVHISSAHWRERNLALILKEKHLQTALLRSSQHWIRQLLWNHGIPARFCSSVAGMSNNTVWLLNCTIANYWV